MEGPRRNQQGLGVTPGTVTAWILERVDTFPSYTATARYITPKGTLEQVCHAAMDYDQARAGCLDAIKNALEGTS